MFPDSEVAAQFSLGKSKCRYMLLFGIAPHFKSILDILNTSSFYSVSFGESLNSVIQKDGRRQKTKADPREGNFCIITETLAADKSKDLSNTAKATSFCRTLKEKKKRKRGGLMTLVIFLFSYVEENEVFTQTLFFLKIY